MRSNDMNFSDLTKASQHAYGLAFRWGGEWTVYALPYGFYTVAGCARRRLPGHYYPHHAWNSAWMTGGDITPRLVVIEEEF